MGSTYKRLGNYIKEVNKRNLDLTTTNLLGVNIDKFFMPSVANVIGTDMSNYKIVKKEQFACNRMHVGRDYRLPIALSRNEDTFLVSPAYDVFEVIDTNVLNPEYLMMWFSRKEFDRNAWFYTDADVRGGLHWNAFCDMQLPIPDINTQLEIVKEYHIIVNRIKLNESIGKRLEDMVNALYKNAFEKWNDYGLETTLLGELCSLITDGKHGDCVDMENSGYYFVSAKDLANGEINYSNVRQITRSEFQETHNRTNFKVGDILITNSGTIGRMAIGKNLPETNSTTFQKSVAILKPRTKVSDTHYLYCLLKSRIKDIIEMSGGTSQHPGYKNVQAFEKQVIPIFKKQHLTTQQNFKLKKLRELILAKMSKSELFETEQLV